MRDTYRHKGLRKRLVHTLRQRGISDEAVLAAIGAVPRHFFLDKTFEEHAYDDKALPIAHGQTISQPFTVAYQTSLLEIKPDERVLEIGTGSGYQAAILAALGAQVYSVERQEGLYAQTKALLGAMQWKNVHCFFGDGTGGLLQFAPYDKVLVTAGAPVVPEALRSQLAWPGGVLVIPVGKTVQKMHKITRTGRDTYKEEELDAFRFVPLLEGVAPR